MASTNQSPQYLKAQSMFFQAKNNDEKLRWLEEMIRECPKHKSSEKMLANLKTRYIKLKEKKEKMQAVIIGFTNSGKSSLLKALTNASPEITPYNFTTKRPVVGITDYLGTKIQIIEVPAFSSEYYDKGLANSADVILILVTDMNQIKEIESSLERSVGKRIIALNSFGKSYEELRKIEATLKSKKYNFIILDINRNLNELKEKLFSGFGKIRVFTKEPTHKTPSDRPMILEKDSTVKDIAQKILKNLSFLKETRIWGPSSKFPGQIVGLQHKLKDMDTIEFKTR